MYHWTGQSDALTKYAKALKLKLAMLLLVSSTDVCLEFWGFATHHEVMALFWRIFSISGLCRQLLQRWGMVQFEAGSRVVQSIESVTLLSHQILYGFERSFVIIVLSLKMATWSLQCSCKFKQSVHDTRRSFRIEHLRNYNRKVSDPPTLCSGIRVERELVMSSSRRLYDDQS